MSGRLHEIHWWQVKGAGESKVGKSLGLEKKQNRETQSSFSLEAVG